MLFFPPPYPPSSPLPLSAFPRTLPFRSSLPQSASTYKGSGAKPNIILILFFTCASHLLVINVVLSLRMITQSALLLNNKRQKDKLNKNMESVSPLYLDHIFELVCQV
jgi:hypothetical protein